MQIESINIRNSIRATMAVAIALLLAHFMPDQRAYWIPMTTIVLMQISLGASIKKSKQRIVGTILGVLVGVMLAVIFHHNMLGLFVTLPFFVLFIIYVMPFSYSFSIFLISTMVIMLLAYKSPYPWHFAISRSVDTLLGAAITLVASIFLFPAWAKEGFYNNLIKGIEECNRYFETIMNKLLSGTEPQNSPIADIIEIEEQLTTIRQRLDDYSHEPHSMIIADGSAYAIIISQERMHSILSCLQIIVDDHRNKELPETTKKCVNNFFQQAKKIGNKLVSSTEKHSELPNFNDLDPLFHPMREAIETNNNNPSLVLLYRNLFNYASELKHIVQSIKQLRNNNTKVYH